MGIGGMLMWTALADEIYKKTNIAVVCSRWNEPFGRTSLEASSRGCAVIISNRGGLPETITNGITLKNLDTKNLFLEIYFPTFQLVLLTLIMVNPYKLQIMFLPFVS